MLGSPPEEGEDIYLDGESLAGLGWRSKDGASFVYTEVEPGTHQLTSEGKMFAAYVYSTTYVSGSRGGAYGYSVHGGNYHII